MVDIANRQEKATAKAEVAERRPLPRWMITVASVTILLIVWEIFGRRINPVFGSYPSAIAEAFWELVVTGQLWSALYDSLRPFVIGYALAILIGVPLGLFIGGFRAAEAALGWLNLRTRRDRRWWVASVVVAVLVTLAIGLLSATGLIGRVVVG
jgi:NitT/TauT family transport system permease protein